MSILSKKNIRKEIKETNMKISLHKKKLVALKDFLDIIDVPNGHPAPTKSRKKIQRKYSGKKSVELNNALLAIVRRSQGGTVRTISTSVQKKGFFKKASDKVLVSNIRARMTQLTEAQKVKRTTRNGKISYASI